jgi:hypothetical protein
MFRSRRVFVFAFVFSCGLASLLAGGYGVDLNIFFNALAAAVIACGLAVSDIITTAKQTWPTTPNPSPALMFAVFCIVVMTLAPGQLLRDREKMRLLRVSEDQFNSAVAWVKSRPGPALCESILLCYEAGKPLEFEPFSVRSLVDAGTLAESDVLQLLKTTHFQTVQVALRSDEGKLSETALEDSLSSDQTLPDTKRRFTPNFMKELLQDYRLSQRTSDLAIFTPK